MGLNITTVEEITEVIGITGTGLLDELKLLPQVGNNTGAYNTLVEAGQIAYAKSYPWVYYVSMAFGGLSIVCSLFLGDIKKYMTDHVAVHLDKVPTGHHHLHHDHPERKVEP